MDVTVQQSARKGELMEEMFIKDLEKIAQSEGFDISIHIIENSACMDFYADSSVFIWDDVKKRETEKRGIKGKLYVKGDSFDLVKGDSFDLVFVDNIPFHPWINADGKLSFKCDHFSEINGLFKFIIGLCNMQFNVPGCIKPPVQNEAAEKFFRELYLKKIAESTDYNSNISSLLWGAMCEKRPSQETLELLLTQIMDFSQYKGFTFDIQYSGDGYRVDFLYSGNVRVWNNNSLMIETVNNTQGYIFVEESEYTVKFTDNVPFHPWIDSDGAFKCSSQIDLGKLPYIIDRMIKFEFVDSLDLNINGNTSIYVDFPVINADAEAYYRQFYFEKYIESSKNKCEDKSALLLWREYSSSSAKRTYITLTFKHPTKTVTVEVSVKDDVSANAILDALVSEKFIEAPTSEVQYVLYVNGLYIEGEQTLLSAGVKNNDVINIVECTKFE